VVLSALVFQQNHFLTSYMLFMESGRRTDALMFLVSCEAPRAKYGPQGSQSWVAELAWMATLGATFFERRCNLVHIYTNDTNHSLDLEIPIYNRCYLPSFFARRENQSHAHVLLPAIQFRRIHDA